MTSPPPLPPPFDPNKSCQPAWRQACQWLNQCHVLSPEANRILNQPESTIENLADILSDGLITKRFVYENYELIYFGNCYLQSFELFSARNN